MKTPKAYQPAYFLKQQGYKKSGDKYINPLTGRKLTKTSALKKAAQVLGWKDFDKYKAAFNTIPKHQSQTAYERFAGYARSKGRPTEIGSKFYMLFREAFNTNPPFKPRSKELTALLTYLGKRNKNTKYAAGESPRKQRRYKR